MPPKRVYVGNLPRDVREREVEDLFRDYRPDDITVKEGFAFLIFDNSMDADDAIRDLDGKQYVGRRVRVEEANKGVGGSGGGGGRGRDSSRYQRRKPQSPKLSRRGDYRVLVEDLPYRASWQDLKDFARDRGCPRPVGTEVYNKSGESVGILEFMSRNDLEEAIDCLDRQKIVPGRGARHHYPATTIRAFEDCGSRSRSRGRQRGRSPSRSQRRSRSYSERRSRSRQRDSVDDRRDLSFDRNRGESRERERDGRSTRIKRETGYNEYSATAELEETRGRDNIKIEPIRYETRVRDNMEGSAYNQYSPSPK